MLWNVTVYCGMCRYVLHGWGAVDCGMCRYVVECVGMFYMGGGR